MKNFVEVLNNIESVFQARIIVRTINWPVMINIAMVYCDLSRSAENICIPETRHCITSFL